MAEKRKYDEANNDENEVISLQDIINEDEELETTANAVLGGSDDQDCTYKQGYVSRQALYACSSCSMDGSPVGVCLACSLECHEGHDLYELYTKRDFCCDCGNGKCLGLVCKLCPEKRNFNDDNEYNQNFLGVYCTCGRPYPDAEDNVVDEMIQCIICEDWFHSRHLEKKELSLSSDYAEMICHLCMKQKTEFLWYYNLDLNKQAEVDVISNQSCEESKRKQMAKLNEVHYTNNENPDKSSVSNSSTESQTFSNFHKENSRVNKPDCMLQFLKRKFGLLAFKAYATFWPDDWRGNICSCVHCIKMLKEKKLMFLLNKEDPVAEYEKRGSSKYENSSMERGMQALGGMNRLQQIEVIHGYNDMKGKLTEFLKTFADEGKVVTEEDIKTFFKNMTERKRKRVVIPHNCK